MNTTTLTTPLTAGLPVNHEAEEEVHTSKPVSVFDALTSHVRRILLEIINLMINYDWLFRQIGHLNGRFKFIESVFLVYPADDSYAYAYVYEHRRRKVVWKPWFSGLLFQNGKITVMFCISANNSLFESDAEKPNMQLVHDRMEELRRLFKANQKTFAGILPSVLSFRRILTKAPESDVTASAVVQSVNSVMKKEHADPDAYIIVLGGRGHIGRRVTQLLREDHENVICVDKDDSWPKELKGERVIVVNITRRKALEDYIGKMWSGTVVINEVYPEPSAKALAEMDRKGIKCYHIVGVEAFALPSFPHAYAGAAPCCAAWPANKMKSVVVKLTDS